ncbi:MAG: hypothetical protein AAF646_00040 [Pseudomonadota bacterium]
MLKETREPKAGAQDRPRMADPGSSQSSETPRADSEHPVAQPQAGEDVGASSSGQSSQAIASVERVEAHVLSMLCTAVLCQDRPQSARDLRAILELGVPTTEIIDRYIPEAARVFGEAWLSGGHSFAEVTIATARLQGWLRDLDMAQGATDPFRLDAPEVLLVVPESCHHTLGAMVAVSRFRRLGALVRLCLGQDARTVGRIVRAGHYDMIALSAAGNEGLDFLATLINSVRSGLGPVPYVVLGGEILNQYRDAPALVGADFGTSDPEEALTLCGLTISASAGFSERNRSTTMRGDPERVSERV